MMKMSWFSKNAEKDQLYSKI